MTERSRFSFKSNLRSYLNDSVRAFDRAPVEVALAVLTAVLFSYAVETQSMEGWLQFAVGAFLAFCCAWSATLLHALRALTYRQRWLITGAGLLIGVTYILLIDGIEPDAEAWRAFMLVVVAAMLVFSVLAWYRSTESASLRLRRINGRFALRAIGIYLYGLALFAGLALALRAIEQLFELHLDGQIYGHVFGWIMLVLVPWVIVGGLHDYIRPLDEQSDVARVVQRLTSFLVPPLLVIYFIILYIYAIRIAVTGELPKNLVSPMVIAAGLLTALAITLFDPQPNDDRAAARLLRVAPLVFLPLVPLGFWALGTRIEDYGWTEFRLLRVIVLTLLGVLAVLGSWQLLRRRSFSLRVLPVALGATLLFFAIGPLSVQAIARRDQQQRLRAALASAQVATPVVRDTTLRIVDSDLYQRINNGGSYLFSHFGDDAVAEVIGIRGTDENWRWQLADYAGLAPSRGDTVAEYLFGNLARNSAVATPSGLVYRVELGGMVTADSTILLIRLPNDTLYADLAPVISKLSATRRRPGNELTESVPVLDRQRQVRADLVLFNLHLQRTKGILKVTQLEGMLLYRQNGQP